PGLHGDRGRGREVSAYSVGDEGDRADRLRRLADLTTQAHPQLGGTPGHAEADPGAIDGKATESEAHGDQAPLAAGEPRPQSLLPALGGLEEGNGVALQDRLGAGSGELPRSLCP